MLSAGGLVFRRGLSNFAVNTLLLIPMEEKLEISEVYRAAQVLRDVARHPRMIGPTRLCPDAEVYLKPENLQHTGAFKLRGAYYKISQLTPEEREKGVIACSAGNHAQGVALAATANGIRSLICSPPVPRYLKSRLHAAWAPRCAWCRVCMTMPIRRLWSCRRSTDIPSSTRLTT